MTDRAKGLILAAEVSVVMWAGIICSGYALLN
jgi:hypothetical protein